MTEEEARLKVCPILIIGRPVLDENKYCIVHKCMMWRWDDGNSKPHKNVLGITVEPSGFCGLAGRP